VLALASSLALDETGHEDPAARDTRGAADGIPRLEGAGSLADDLAEATAERPQTAVADGMTDLGDGEVRRAQEVLGPLDPALAEVGDGGEPVDAGERPDEVELAQPGDGRELVEVELVGEAAVDVVAGPAQVDEHVTGDTSGALAHRPSV